MTVPLAMGFPSMSNMRMATGAGVAVAAMLWLVPEMAASVANSGRDPKAEKGTQVLLALRQAFEIAVSPSASGPTVIVAVAKPAALVIELAGATIPEVLCQVTCWPASGEPPLSANACTGHCTPAPAAR